MITLLHSLKDVALKDESSNRMTHTYLLQALISADFCCRSYRAAADRGDNYKKAFIVPVVIDGLSLLCGHATLLVLPSLLPPCPPAPSPTSGRMPARARPPARVPSNWCRLLDTANRMMKKRGDTVQRRASEIQRCDSKRVPAYRSFAREKTLSRV